MAPNIKTSVDKLIADAEREIQTLDVAEAIRLHSRDDVVFVDIRDIRELARDGRIPGAFHCPRGMLEFWVDPESPYHKPVFGDDKEYVLFCAAGWRSALAAKTLVEMGLTNVAHIEGGFGAWKQAGHPVADKAKKGGGQ